MTSTPEQAHGGPESEIDSPTSVIEGPGTDVLPEDEVEPLLEPPPVDTSGHPDPRLSATAPVAAPHQLSVLLYSDDTDTRAAVRMAVGKRVASDLPPVTWTECATQPAVLAAVDGGGIDVLILDGEAAPAGGMGLCKQLKDEIYECPPVLVLTGRPQDAWLATWSRADAAVPHPLDPAAVAEAVAGLARRRLGVHR